MFCSAVTKVSKKLQVWRAMMRSRCLSSAVKLARRATRAGRLADRARSGAHSHASRKGTAIQGIPRASTKRSRVKPKTSKRLPDILRENPSTVGDPCACDCAVVVHCKRLRRETVKRYRARRMAYVIVQA